MQSQPHETSTVEVDQRVLAKRGKYLTVVDDSGEPWNEWLACAAGVEETGAGPHIRLVLARYFQYLSACGPIEDETYAAIAKPSRRTPLRDSVLCDAETAMARGRGAHAFGMQVATVFDTGSRQLVLIQRRSYAVSITVEVQRRSARVDPTWFYREAPNARLLSVHHRGQLDFRLLGFGFDALNGEMDMCALAHISDESDVTDELAAMTTNWEIQDIDVYDLWGDALSAAMLAGEFSPGCVFTLARAREVLADRRPGR